MSRPDYLLGEVRRLTALHMAGGPPAFDAFLDLVSLLLNLTILAPRGAVRLTTGPRRNTAILGGWRGPSDPLPLRDGKFLRATILLYLDQTQEGERLKIQESSYQCQADALGERWIARYDYLRYPPSGTGDSPWRAAGARDAPHSNSCSPG